jgi:repressor LexA
MHFNSGGNAMAYGKISDKQREILNFIKTEIINKGYPPSVRDICEAVNLKSTSSVHAHLDTLEKNGYIKRDPTKPRAIEIIDKSFQTIRHGMVSVPVIRNVVNSLQILDEDNIEGYLPMPSNMIPEGEAFAFVINSQDNKLKKLGIFDGDNVFVQMKETFENGDIVVGLYRGSLALKLYESINSKKFIILGKVFGVFRQYN